MNIRIAYSPETGTGTAPGDLTATGEVVVVEPEVQEPEPEPEPAPAPDTVPREIFLRRVETLTRQKAALEAQLAAQAATTAPGQTPPPAVRPDAFEEAVNARAAQRLLEAKSQDIATQGQALAPDFMNRVQNMNATLGTLPNSFLEALAEVADPKTSAQILYDLGGDLGKAATIISMSPAKQAVALAKIAAGMEKKVVATSTAPVRAPAPSPITPKVGAGQVKVSTTVDLGDAKVSIDDWMAQRDATARRRR